MATHDKKTPDWLVERLALGDLDAAAAADVRRRLAAEGRDADAEVAAVAASNREILEQLPPARVAAAVRERAGRARKAPRAWLVAMPLVFAGAGALMLLAPAANVTQVARAPELARNPEYVGIKGDPALHVYKRVGLGSERLVPGARVARGDLLRLAYLAGERGNFGAVLSIDGRGHVTVHWPEGEATVAAPLSPKGEVQLPSAYELDDAPAFERFFLVTSESPFAMSTVIGAARTLAARPEAARAQALALPSPLHQKSVTLAKPSKETP
jgi:hypothetical protein